MATYYYLRENWIGKEKVQDFNPSYFYDLVDVYDHIKNASLQHEGYSAQILEHLPEFVVLKVLKYEGNSFYIVCKEVANVVPEVEKQVVLRDRWTREEIVPPKSEKS